MHDAIARRTMCLMSSSRIDPKAILDDSTRAKAVAAVVLATSGDVYGRARETVAQARNHRQVGALRRAVKRRLSELTDQRPEKPQTN